MWIWMSNGEDGNGDGRDAGSREECKCFYTPPQSQNPRCTSGFLGFSSHSSFFIFNISPVIIFPVSKPVSVAASVTVINKVVVAGLLWDRWGSIWDLYVFQVKEA